MLKSKLLVLILTVQRQLPDELKTRFEEIDGIVDISLNIKESTPELQVHLDRKPY